MYENCIYLRKCHYESSSTYTSQICEEKKNRVPLGKQKNL